MKFRNASVLSLVSGACFATALLSPYFWWLGLFGFVLLLHVLKNVTSATIAFLSAWLVGFIASGAGVVWFWDAYPIYELGETAAFVQYAFIGWLWGTVSFAMGLGTAIFGWLTYKYFIKATAFIPFVWLCSEWLKAVFFSIYSYGPGGSINGYFSFSQSGYTLVPIDMFLHAWAPYGGVYVLTFVFAVIGVCLFLLLLTQLSSARRLSVLFLILIAVSSYSLNQRFESGGGEGQKVIVIETHIQAKSEARADALRQAFEGAVELQPDFIIAPEDAGVQLAYDSDEAVLAVLENSTTTTFIDSYSRINQDQTTTLVTSVYRSGAEVGEYSKNYLVPQGEFAPHTTDWLFKLALSSENYQSVEERLAYRPSFFEAQQELEDGVPGILFCFESNKPTGVRELLKNSETKPPFIAHIVSHGWFNEPQSLWVQQDAMLKVQAVWNGVSIVVAPNMAEAKLYRPNGEVKYGTELFSGGVWRLVEFKI